MGSKGWATVAAALLAAVGLVGGGVVAPTARAESGMDKYLKQQPKWGSCDSFGSAELSKRGLECARVTVPIDYKKLDGKTAQLAISRLPATGQKIGSLLTNPGGPGGVGLDLPLGLSKSLADRFDVIGVDVRGLGASTPSLLCQSGIEHQVTFDYNSHDMSPGGIDRAEQAARAYTADCAQRSGKELLEHAGTADVARDFDVIRAVLGDAKLNYLGFSYGTRLGSTMAELFPDRIRTMVLDGGVDPARNMLDPVDFPTGVQHTFEIYATDCAKAADCPLGTDPRQTTQRFRELLLPLLDHPATTTDGQGLGYDAALDAVVGELYHQKNWPTITKALTELAHGAGDTLEAIEAALTGGVDHDVHTAVKCLEDTRVTDRSAAADIDRRYRSAAPIFDDGRGTGKAPLDVCAFWPVKTTAQPHSPKISGLPKVVVVAAVDDPATPYQEGVALAKALGAGLLTYEAAQHTIVAQGSDCIDQPVLRYLIDLTPPAEGLRCPAI
ncbi:alpha/beta fold hydrolase [Nocardia concava]|uniref:alpha/beta fold hydrolase n=1 Tax=Nocardia concava TaxID=257281 RepID=UPI00031ADF9E|nr:alpha/beta fold hydrolase [Nocardia concava]